MTHDPLDPRLLRGALQARLLPVDGTGSVSMMVPGPLGAGVAGGMGSTWYTPYELFSFTSTPWNVTGKQPVSWLYLSHPAKGSNVLLVFVGPEVTLKVSDNLLAIASRIPQDLIPAVEVFRVSSTDFVPDEPDGPRITELFGTRTDWVIEPEQPGTEAAIAFGRMMSGSDDYQLPRIGRATIAPAPTGFDATHALAHWNVEVRVPADEPARFAYELMPPPPDSFNATFAMRIVRTPNTSIDGFGMESLTGGELLSTISLDVATVALNEVPEQGYALDGFRFQPLALRERWSAASVKTGKEVEAMIGMVPIVGSLVNLAHVIYMAKTHETFWGDPVSDNEIMVNGVFALMGVVADSGEALSILSEVSERIAPGMKLIKPNPGFPSWLSGRVGVTTNPFLLEAATRASSEGRLMPLLETLDEVSAGRSSIAELTEVFQEVVLATYDDVLDLSVAPTTIYAKSFETIHPTTLEGFDALARDTQRAVVASVDAVRMGERSAEELMNDLEPGLWKTLNEALDEWRVSRVFNGRYDGFSKPLLATGFADYVNRGGAKNAVQWAAKQLTGKYADALAMDLGSAFRDVIKRVQPEKYWEVSAAAKAHFESLANLRLEYSELRDANKGFGSLFEVDHIFEKRFLTKPEFDKFVEHTDDFAALLVPKNGAIASQLEPFFYYVHSVKTQALRRLIPNGAEAAFTLQEIYDAYVLVMVHQLKVDLPVFDGLTKDFFGELARVSGEPLDTTILPAEQIYGRNPAYWRPPS